MYLDTDLEGLMDFSLVRPSVGTAPGGLWGFHVTCGRATYEQGEADFIPGRPPPSLTVTELRGCTAATDTACAPFRVFSWPLRSEARWGLIHVVPCAP